MYDKSSIFKQAWNFYRASIRNAIKIKKEKNINLVKITFSEALKKAWRQAKSNLKLEDNPVGIPALNF